MIHLCMVDCPLLCFPIFLAFVGERKRITTTRRCRWQSLQCSKSSKERCQLVVAAEALATLLWMQSFTSMFAEFSLLKVQVIAIFLHIPSYSFIFLHIPSYSFTLTLCRFVPQLYSVAVLGSRCCDESVFARLEIVALHLIEESQHLQLGSGKPWKATH